MLRKYVAAIAGMVGFGASQAQDGYLAQQQAWLDANAARAEVQVTGSGLQIEMTRAGDGASPDSNDRVTVHYEGRLIDGEKFDSSYDRGEPTTFGVNQVIPGWTEGLQLMKIGGAAKLYIPPELAYGPRGAGDVIPPNAALIFKIELIDVEPQPGP